MQKPDATSVRFDAIRRFRDAFQRFSDAAIFDSIRHFVDSGSARKRIDSITLIRHTVTGP